MQGVFFLSGLPRLCEAVAGRFIPRQDCFQKRFEFCTMNTANWENANVKRSARDARRAARLGFERAFGAKTKRIYQSKYGSSRFVFRFFGSLERARRSRTFCPATPEPRSARRGQNSVRAIFKIHRQKTKSDFRAEIGSRRRRDTNAFPPPNPESKRVFHAPRPSLQYKHTCNISHYCHRTQYLAIIHL